MHFVWHDASLAFMVFLKLTNAGSEVGVPRQHLLSYPQPWTGGRPETITPLPKGPDLAEEQKGESNFGRDRTAPTLEFLCRNGVQEMRQFC